MDKEQTYEYLRNAGVSFELTEHKAVYSMGELDAVELPYPGDDAKNLLVRDRKKRNWCLVTIRGDKRVDLKAFGDGLGLKGVGFASADDLMAIMGVAPGSVSPLGLLADEERKVALYLDKEFEGGRVGIHPNDNTATVWLAATDLVRVIEEHGNPVHWIEIPVREDAG